MIGRVNSFRVADRQRPSFTCGAEPLLSCGRLTSLLSDVAFHKGSNPPPPPRLPFLRQLLGGLADLVLSHAGE